MGLRYPRRWFKPLRGCPQQVSQRADGRHCHCSWAPGQNDCLSTTDGNSTGQLPIWIWWVLYHLHSTHTVKTNAKEEINTRTYIPFCTSLAWQEHNMTTGSVSTREIVMEWNSLNFPQIPFKNVPQSDLPTHTYALVWMQATAYRMLCPHLNA